MEWRQRRKMTRFDNEEEDKHPVKVNVDLDSLKKNDAHIALQMWKEVMSLNYPYAASQLRMASDQLTSYNLCLLMRV